MIKNDYDLTVDVAIRASAGWKLYLQKEFAGEHRDGHYTNPEPDNQGHEFWSDGENAKFDRDHNGHFETIFVIKDGNLVNRGSIGDKGKFVHTARAFQNQPSGEPSDASEENGAKTNQGYLGEPDEPDVASQTDKATIERANEGWTLYRKKEFAGEHRDGHYTDPEPKRGYEFWSDEVIAKFDRDNNGHHESIFFVTGKSKLEYVGKIGSKGKFTEVEKRFRKFKNQSLANFERTAQNVKRGKR